MSVGVPFGVPLLDDDLGNFFSNKTPTVASIQSENHAAQTSQYVHSFLNFLNVRQIIEGSASNLRLA